MIPFRLSISVHTSVDQVVRTIKKIDNKLMWLNILYRENRRARQSRITALIAALKVI